MSDVKQTFDARLAAQLQRLANKQRRRELNEASGIDVSSNDYLGLADHPKINAALRDALAKGVPHGAAASRLLRGQTTWHAALEKRLAAFLGTETALLFNSGYDANVGALSTLFGAGDTIFADELIHASMIDGIRASKARRERFAHNDPVSLEALLAKTPNEGTRVIVVESIYSMDGDIAPLRAFVALAKRYQALLYVDEAHATGVFGPNGAGVLEELGLTGCPVVTVHTFGKAWGGFGACIACSEMVRDYLVNRCRNFIYTTALSPLQTVQLSAAMDVIRDEPWRRERVLEMARRLRDGLVDIIDTGHSASQIVPVILGRDAVALTAAETLRAAGFDIRAIRPPSVPRGTARLRLSLSANLSDKALNQLIAVCQRELPKILED